MSPASQPAIAPIIKKTVSDPNCTCGLIEGDYCVTTETEITVEAFDQGCCPGLDVSVYYHIFNGSWSDWEEYEGPITFNEECMHYLEIMAKDCLNNTNIDNETFYVDETPPEISIIIGEPNCTCDDLEEIICINTSTPIEIEAFEQGCCPCPEVKIWYRKWFNEDWSDWVLYEDEPITFDQECMHKLGVMAQDCLNNTNYENYTFYVDETPPELIKTTSVSFST